MNVLAGISRLLGRPRKGARDIDHTDHADSAAHAGQASAGAARSSQRTAAFWRLALVGLVFVPVILACSTTHSTVSLASAPATSLAVSVGFKNGLLPRANVEVGLYIQNAKLDTVKLTGGQTFSIDGVKIPPSGHVTIPSQPSGAGSFYTLTYTDEHGQQTVVHIPAPQTDFAVTYPEEYGNEPLPRPLHSANDQPVPTPSPGQPRPPELDDSPLIVNYTLPYPINSLPQDPVAGALGQRNMYTVGAQVSPQCSPAWPKCAPQYPGEMIQNPVTADDSIQLSDSDIGWGNGFEQYTTGYCQVVASMYVGWSMPATGFYLLNVVFDADQVTVPFNLV